MSGITIQLSSAITLNVLSLSNEEFFKLDAQFYAKPTFESDLTFNAYISEKRRLEERLRSELSQYWIHAEDFEVGSDSNLAFTLCGGIYSLAPICRRYLEVMHGAIASTLNHEKWMYDTSIELGSSHQFETCGFRLQGNTVFANADDLKSFDVINALCK